MLLWHVFCGAMFVLYQRQAGHNNNQCHLDMCRGLNPPWCRRMALILSARRTLQQRTAQVVVQFIQSSILVLSALHWLFHPATKVRFSTCFNKFIHDENFVVLFIGSDFISSSQQKLHTGTLWSVSFIDIDFIRWRFLCLGIVLYWFSKGTWFMGALKVDSSNRPTVASARAQLSSLLHWSWFYQQRPRPARDIRALKNFPLRDASGSFLN